MPDLYKHMAIHSQELLKIRSMISPNNEFVKNGIYHQIVSFAEALAEHSASHPVLYTVIDHGPVLGIAVNDEMNTVFTISRSEAMSVRVHTSLYQYTCEKTEQLMFVHDRLTSLYRNLSEKNL